MSENIDHIGFVGRINGDTILIRITQQSACPGCRAQPMCSASEKKDKIIEVPDRLGRFHVSGEVIICGQNSMGLQAVLLVFIIPLVIVVGAIVIGTNLQWGKTTSGLTGLSFLLPYYYILYLMYDELEGRFISTSKKFN